MNGPEDITVIMPAYNAAAFLERALESVAAQRLQPWGIIVADDGSSDATVAVAESFAASHSGCVVRVLCEPHRGPGAARNAAVRAAQTTWVAFLDADDRWETDKIAHVVEQMAAHPSANFLCHNQTIRFMDGTSRVTDLAAAYDPSRPLPPQLWKNNLFMTSAVVCRRDMVMSVGGFDESLKSAQDYELWLRMSPGMIVQFIDRPLGEYFERPGNISTTRFWRQLRNLWRVKQRHRDKVGAVRYVTVMLYATLFHLWQWATAVVKQRAEGRGK